MALQTPNGGFNSGEGFRAIRDNAAGAKAQAQNALAALQAGSVNSDFIFRMLDQFNSLITALNLWKAITGLDAYATSQGYTGTLSADCTTCVNAAQACINWVVTNFPKDSTLTWLMSHQLNADGTRTPRTFTTAQTAGLQTNLTAFIATIG